MQGSQTRGPRAACEPPDVFMQPALSSKLLFLLIVETTVLFTFYALWWPAETFLPDCAARELVLHQMWPANIVEFETLALHAQDQRNKTFTKNGFSIIGSVFTAS